MAITFDNASSAVGNTVTNISFVHTNSAADNCMLAGIYSLGGFSASAVAYDTRNMVSAGFLLVAAGSPWLMAYRTYGETTGAKTVSVAMAGSDQFIVGVVSYNNVYPATNTGAATATATGTSINLSVSSQATNTIFAFLATNAVTFIPTDGQTTRFKVSAGVSFQGNMMGSEKAGAATTTSLSWALTTSDNCGMLGLCMSAMDTTTTGVRQGITSAKSINLALNYSLSHQCIGANRCVFAILQGGMVPTVSAITYGGVNMSQMSRLSISSNLGQSIYVLQNPVSGHSVLKVHYTASFSGVMAVLGYMNVDQTTPYSGLFTQTASGVTTQSYTISSDVSDMYFAAAVSGSTPVNASLTAVGVPQLYSKSIGAQLGEAWGQSASASASIFTINYVSSANVQIVVGMVNVRFNSAAAGASIPPFNLALTGVGK